MTQQRKIWESFTLKWVELHCEGKTEGQKSGMANKKEEKFQKATSWFVLIWPQKLHWTCIFFFSLKHCQCPRGKPATSLQRSCSTVKKESSSFYRGWRHCWQLGIYYFCFAKLFKGQTMIIILNGICVTKDCECMWFLDHFVLTVQLQKHSVKWEKMVHV